MAIETRIINGSFTELYTGGGGNFMTQAKATHFHSFWTRKILAPTESIDDFKEVTAAEKAKLEAADAAWERPPQSFIDAWNTRADYTTYGDDFRFGQYNEGTGYFELNTILDIDYPEAREIMEQSDTKQNGASTQHSQIPFGVRTLMPTMYGTTLSASPLAYSGTLETYRVISYYGSYTNYNASQLVFVGRSLRAIYGSLSMRRSLTIGICTMLEEVSVYNTTTDGLTINLVNSPLLSLESINYTIENSTKTLTIILHPDAYARVTEEMFEKAAAKGITITSE